MMRPVSVDDQADRADMHGLVAVTEAESLHFLCQMTAVTDRGNENNALAVDLGAVSVPGQLSARWFRGSALDIHLVYDCLYVALAEIEKAPLITSDQRLLRTVASTRWGDLVQDLTRWRHG